MNTINNNILNNLESILNLKAFNTINVVSIEATNIPKELLLSTCPLLEEDNLIFIRKLNEMPVIKRYEVIEKSLKIFNFLATCIKSDDFDRILPSKEDYNNQLLPIPLLKSQITLYLYNKIDFIINNIKLDENSVLSKLNTGEFEPKLNFVYFMDSLNVASDKMTVGIFQEELNLIIDLTEDEFNEYLKESEYGFYILNAMFMYRYLKTSKIRNELQLLSSNLIQTDRYLPNNMSGDFFIELSLLEHESLEVKYFPKFIFTNIDDSLQKMNDDEIIYLDSVPIPKNLFTTNPITISNLCDLILDYIKDKYSIKSLTLDFTLNKIVIVNLEGTINEIEDIKDTLLFYIDDSLRQLLNIECLAPSKFNEYMQNKDKLIENIFITIIDKYL